MSRSRVRLRWLCCKIRPESVNCLRWLEQGGRRMSDFKGRHFGGEIVLWAVRWYCRYPISYRDLETMMTERGVAVDHSTIYRWVQHFAPEMQKRLRWQWRRPQSRSWRIDETYVKVRGKWAYLYRALDKLGNTIDFYLSATRNTKAAKRFLGKALRAMKDWELPEVLNTDKAPTYAAAIAELKAEGKCPNGCRSRAWKHRLQKFADEARLRIHVSHFPPGTSKWNKIEHRLFCHITQNWRGKPLRTPDCCKKGGVL